MAPGGPPVSEEQWRALARQWFPQIAGTGVRQVSWREIALYHDLCVPKTLSTSCEQAIFADEATDASLPSDAVVLKGDRFG